MPKTPEELFSYLDGLGIAVTTARHPPLRTVAESQALRGTIAGAHTRNLFLRDRRDAHFLVTVEEDAPVDLKTIHRTIGASGKVSFGRPEALMELLGVMPGAVTVFGLLNDTTLAVTPVLDSALVGHGTVNCHPLTNEATTSIASGDLLRFVRATGHEPLVLNVAGGSPH